MRADYKFTIVERNAYMFIVIIDLENGKNTVEHDMANILAEIVANSRPHPDLSEVLIIYQDTNGKWHGWDNVSSTSITLYDDESVTGAMDEMIFQGSLERIIPNQTLHEETEL